MPVWWSVVTVISIVSACMLTVKARLATVWMSLARWLVVLLLLVGAGQLRRKRLPQISS